MRNKVLFYLIWDVLFFLQLFVFSTWGNLIKAYTQQTFNFQFFWWFQLFWMIIIGGFFCMLVVKSKQYQADRKSAVLEFVLIGVPASYCAIVPVFVYQIRININLLMGLFINPMPAAVCGILLGYELFLFLMRIFKYK